MDKINDLIIGVIALIIMSALTASCVYKGLDYEYERSRAIAIQAQLELAQYREDAQ